MTAVSTRPDQATEIPPHLRRMNDVDSHEMIPVHMWPDEFGEAGQILKGIADAQSNGVFHNAGDNTWVRPDITGDDTEITSESVWAVKGPKAPAAIDMARRPAVLDAMGISRQLIFPSFGFTAMYFAYHDRCGEVFGFDETKLDRFEVGRKIVASHNQWASRVAKSLDAQRLRAVGILMTDDVTQMIRDAENFLAEGVPAFWISGSAAPGGTSPANPKLDPFWRLLAESNAVVTLHLGTEFGLLRDSRWADGVAQFVPSTASALEFPIEPYRAATTSLQGSNFLTAMTLGGVFERHPQLRFGVIECSASWVGPLANTLDIWAEEFSRRLAPHLSMRPSVYIARNVRVTPFHFEPVDEYIERYPAMADVYAYSSDFPHAEGGKYSAHVFHEKLQRLGPDVEEKFFVSNGSWLLPDLQ
jgi:predicted TIM-barrel fold metal-dependent hydrolase